MSSGPGGGRPSPGEGHPPFYLTQTPAQAYKTLRSQPGLQDLPDQTVWDLVALAWKRQTSPAALENGRRLYQANCAACHGEQGRGDGVFAEALAAPAGGEHSQMQTGEMTTRPADFSDPSTMLAVSPAHLQGKIIRGGMGTGMPYWGPIFTEQQTWDLVAYLWSFQFELED